MYKLDYVNENEFHELERALKKYNMRAFKKLNFDYYLLLKDGKFEGKIVSTNKKDGTVTYELKLPSDAMFVQVHGEVKLIYIVDKKEETVMLKEITPKKILLEGNKSELGTYKGIMISSPNPAKDRFKIDLLNMLQYGTNDYNYKDNDDNTSSENIKNIISKDLKIDKNDIKQLHFEMIYKKKYKKSVYEVTFIYDGFDYIYYINSRNDKIIDSYKSQY